MNSGNRKRNFSKANKNPDRLTSSTGIYQGAYFTHWSDWLDIAEEAHKKELRDQVDEIFSERLMIGLSLILLPVLVLPLLFNLSPSVLEALNIIDYAILMVFILEYTLKLAVAEDPRAFAKDPWHILDIFIIVAPLVGLALGSEHILGRSLRLLRTLRIAQALAVGGRAHRRSRYLLLSEEAAELASPELRTQRVQLEGKDGDRMESIWEVVSLLSPYQDIEGREGIEGRKWWLDITYIKELDIPELSRISEVPVYSLGNKLEKRAYPQAETFSGKSLIFTRVPEIRRDAADPRLSYIDWKGLLLVDDGKWITTFSRQEVSRIRKVPEEVKEEGLPLTPPVIVYIIMRDSLSTVEELILTAEEELVALESLPSDMLPPRFLSAIFNIKRGTGTIISWLLHEKEVLSQIAEGKVALSGCGEEDKARFNALLDHCDYIYDAASNANENISSLIDYYINTTSFQMNRVMKVLAVLTALTVIPTVAGGLLGSNLIGNPWGITLAQLVTLVAILMLSTGWAYYKLGWLK